MVTPNGKQRRVPVESQDLRPRLRAYPGRAKSGNAAGKLKAALAASGEGSIRVGQEKAVIAEEITLTYAFVDAANAPVPINGVAHSDAVNGATPAAATPPLRVAMNA